MTKNEDNKRAYEQAKAQISSITDMVAAMETEIESGLEEARQCIHEDPLNVRVRSDWHNVGDTNTGVAEYEILLCTGGPAVRIIGDLDEWNQPASTMLQYQDWFTPWTDYHCDQDESAILLRYAQEFWFGE